jgi:sn-glycerol 3-phosphate transport system permease protein
VLVAVLGIVVSLVLAIFADRIVRGAMVYKTLLICPTRWPRPWPGVLWMFMFSPSIGVVAYLLRQSGFDWNHLLNENQAMTLIVIAARCGSRSPTTSCSSWRACSPSPNR